MDLICHFPLSQNKKKRLEIIATVITISCCYMLGEENQTQQHKLICAYSVEARIVMVQ